MIAPLHDREHLLQQIAALRRQIEPEFRPDTAARGFTGTAPSTGHCAAVALIVQKSFGGEFVSAIVEGGSHWFNRIETVSGQLDVDLTGDQFGRKSIETAAADMLFEGTRVRHFGDLNAETLQRALLLARRSGLTDVVTFLDALSTPRTSTDSR
jgi:hypothetical protein